MMITASGRAVMFVLSAPSNMHRGCDRNKALVSHVAYRPGRKHHRQPTITGTSPSLRDQTRIDRCRSAVVPARHGWERTHAYLGGRSLD